MAFVYTGTGYADTRRVSGSNVGARAQRVQMARGASIVAGVKTGGGADSVSPRRGIICNSGKTRAVRGFLPLGVNK